MIQILKCLPQHPNLKLQLLSNAFLRYQELNLKKLSHLIFVLYNVIKGYVLKYENILLINGMKLDVIILKSVHIGLFLLVALDIHFRKLKKTTKDFNHLGIRCLIGQNILGTKMLLIVYPAFLLLKSQHGGLEVVHLLLKDFIIRRKSMMVHIVLVCSTWEIGYVTS